MVKVRDIMTRDVVTVTEGTTIKDLCSILEEFGLSGVPVVTEDGRLAGIVSEKDIIAHQVAGLGPDFVDHDLYEFIYSKYLGHDELARGRNKMYVEEVMNRGVVTVSPEAGIEEASQILLEKRVHRMPVVENGRVVGIISSMDLLRALLPRGLRK